MSLHRTESGEILEIKDTSVAICNSWDFEKRRYREEEGDRTEDRRKKCVEINAECPKQVL